MSNKKEILLYLIAFIILLLGYFNFSVWLFLIPLVLLFKSSKTKKDLILININSEEDLSNLSIEYTYITEINQFSNLNRLILDNSIKLIALDTEYFKGQTYKGKLCLIQISFYYKNSIVNYIIDLITVSIPKEGTFLSDATIVKVFHSASNDLVWIKEDLEINIENVYDTQIVFHKIKNKINLSSLDVTTKNNISYFGNIGLDTLAKIMLNYFINKDIKKKFQKTNWIERPLNKKYLNYAALDSLILIKIKEKLDEIEVINHEMKTINVQDLKEKALKFYSEGTTNTSSIGSQLFIQLTISIDEFCKENNLNKKILYNKKDLLKSINNINNIKFDSSNFKSIFSLEKFVFDSNKIKNIKQNLEQFLDKSLELINKTISENLNDLPSTEIIKSGKENKQNYKIKHVSQKPVYENCKMLSFEGKILAMCNKNKMENYIKKGLAEKIDDSSFKLTFQHKGFGSEIEDQISSEFYVVEKENKCCICGSNQNYCRFHIIPINYRQFLELKYKSHLSHDVLLLCSDCHSNANKIYDVKIKEISNEFKVPLFVKDTSNGFIDNLHKFMLILKKLFSQTEKINTLGVEKLEKELSKLHHMIIEDYENINIVNNECEKLEDEYKMFLDYLKTISPGYDEYKILNEKFKNTKVISNKVKNIHGKLVVDKVDDKLAFIKMWRLFFVEKFSPKYLPPFWTVDHQFTLSFGEKGN